MRVVIGIPCGRMEPRSWQEPPIVRLIGRASQLGYEMTAPIIQGGPYVAKNRNGILATAEEMGAEACLLLDSDVIPPVDTIERLDAIQAPVASGLYFAHHVPYLPQAYTLRACRESDGRPALFPISEIPESPFPVDAVGGGCLFVRREVWLALAPKPFQMAYGEEESEGEDFFFSRRVRELFGPIWVHPDVLCGHMTMMEIGRAHFEHAIGKIRRDTGRADLLFGRDGRLLEPVP